MKHTYDTYRPYRDVVIEYQQRIGMTKFTKENQFWTLGGPEHHEFERLSEDLKFGKGSYHTVDINGFSRPALSNAMILYPKTDFWDTYKLWQHVGAISYDSTQTMITMTKHGDLVDSSWKVIDLAKRVKYALQFRDSIMVHMNWMIGYANLSNPINNKDRLEIVYPQWLSKFMERFDKCEAFDAYIEKMEGSLTYMIGMHCHVFK